ncbi:MAG: AlkA N-terminal domain-containing protein [Gammaproteobacteria bacterium]
MLSDAEVYELARQNRDPRFDGRFFVGVTTTGIYCRPVCPVRIPKRENVVLFPSAAAAAEAGFRPCLRCRPETSPGTPSWLGSSFTVSKALQIIGRESSHEGASAALAEKLGISTRQLCRLFRKHLGASPQAVIQTHRLQFAKQLLDETTLPVSEVCFAAGFGSVRRFNEVIKTTYGESPTRLRKRPRRRQQTTAGIEIQLHYRPPFDWQAMLDFFAMRAIPGVEQITDRSYQRSFVLDDMAGCFSLVFSLPGRSASLTVVFPDSARLLEIVERVRNMFDLRADSAWIDSELSADQQLAPIVARNPGLRVPGCWDGLEIAVRAIVGQQVSVKAAATLMRRLVERTGDKFTTAAEQTEGGIYRVFPDARRLAGADLSGLGITGSRIEAIQSLARSVANGQLSFDCAQDSENFRRLFCQLKGVGQWTADYVALRALRDPDAFPHGDLILRRALHLGSSPLSPGQLLERAEYWRPWRAYAVMLLWRNYQQSREPQAPA